MRYGIHIQMSLLKLSPLEGKQVEPVGGGVLKIALSEDEKLAKVIFFRIVSEMKQIADFFNMKEEESSEAKEGVIATVGDEEEAK